MTIDHDHVYTIIQVDQEASFLWLSILNFASFLSGVWALNIMSDLSSEYLAKFDYRVSVA